MARVPSEVIMIGTDPATHGGIASAVNAWAQAGLLARWPVTYVATHRDGTRLEKLLRAIDALVAFTALACRVPCAVLHVHAASRASFWRKLPFIAAALLIRWPVVFHLHGGGFAAFYERECGALGRAAVRFVMAHAARVIVVSERWKGWVAATFPRARVDCVPNAVPLRTAAWDARDPARIAFVGRLTREKGVYDLIEAVGALRATQPHVRLELAGEGDADAIARRAHELGIGDRVLIRGWCAASARERILARAGVFALPSHAEGLPMSLLEAMAAGCPVVASRVGGIPDAVHDGTDGLLVPAGDVAALAAALARMLADRGLAARLGGSAQVTVARRHSPAAAIDRIGRVYASLGLVPGARRTPALGAEPT
jgi:glycosyltransferase involved in cell wall biosynthesis